MSRPAIDVNADGSIFQIEGATSSLTIADYHGLPLLLWWGACLAPSPDAPAGVRSDPPPYSVCDEPDDSSWSSARLQLDYAPPLAGDRKAPAFVATSTGAPIVSPRISNWRTYEGRPSLKGLPSARAEGPEAQTLELLLADRAAGLEIALTYTAFEDSDVIAHGASYRNVGRSTIRLSRVSSFSFDLAPRNSFELLDLEGSWARERMARRSPLGPGKRIIGSNLGVSSHRFSPVCAILPSTTTETTGEAWGAGLVWSGDWQFSFEMDEFDNLRCSGGPGAEDFSWELKPGETFECPEALLAWSEQGISGLSSQFHDFLSRRITPPRWRNRPRPILANTWEAAYFDFDAERLDGIARDAARLGAELLVIDDGWFSRRNDDTSSLGDWWPNADKLGGSLDELSRRVAKLGLGLGIWIEPEMVSPDSDLYRSHPDWCLVAPGVPRQTGRNQLVLDLAREEVRAEIARRIKELLSSASFDYVKWDFNRPLGIAGSALLPPERQGEASYRFTLGAYALFEEITGAFPDILFEGCAGGGGRMDFGTLSYFPQYWASDNTDATARRAIQGGAGLFFPPSAFGSHVSAVPNHLTGRSVGMLPRIAAAIEGVFGFELDLAQLSAEDFALAAEACNWYKARRLLLQFGRRLRLPIAAEGDRSGRSPYSEDVAWMAVDEGAGSAIVVWSRLRAIANPGSAFVRLRGLEAAADYGISIPSFVRGPGSSGLAPIRKASELSVTGRELMLRGLEIIPGIGDAAAIVVELTQT
ncbi:MAG TPA: alpha-galactosidase [Rectinemataceae bacterium]|nr:alpha-galactosidase [Rectinemataceae bacterium]